ncbi:arginine N-succinyltransferase [Niveibacterium sp. SC-1]|uniref:arginine N-succinyltransferase n=1 Tax=Niveibacterium sp. SC-1 TaxID=3135646 RepID=UPI00311F505E
MRPQETWILRPAKAGDAPALARLAAQCPLGVTSLPREADALAERITSAAFASDHARLQADGRPAPQTYPFALELAGAVVGTSNIEAHAGAIEPVYNYRQETLIHASRELGVHNEVAVLSLCHDLSGASLLGGFAIDASLLDTPAAELLSRGRLLFMAAHPERFADLIAAELLGPCDDAGNAPFWDAVGRHFFGISYEEAERHSREMGRAFIAELLPQHPVYVPLLPAAAQAAIGAVHPFSLRPAEILRAEGFAFERYVDIFDGGPTLQAPWSEIRSIARHQRANLVAHAGAGEGQRYLVATMQCETFRCVLAEAASDPERGELWMAETDIQALQAQAGDMVVFVEA